MRGSKNSYTSSGLKPCRHVVVDNRHCIAQRDCLHTLLVLLCKQLRLHPLGLGQQRRHLRSQLSIAACRLLHAYLCVTRVLLVTQHAVEHAELACESLGREARLLVDLIRAAGLMPLLQVGYTLCYSCQAFVLLLRCCVRLIHGNMPSEHVGHTYANKQPLHIVILWCVLAG